MDILRVVLTSLFSILLLFLFTKLIGYRQMSELSMFDYINSISFGSIAAELAVAEGRDVWRWSAALAVYALTTAFLSWLTSHSILLRRKITGNAVILMQNGKLYDRNFQTVHLDLNEFLMQLRNSGYFDVSALDTVLFEPNGKLSVLPKSQLRPTIPQDFELEVPQEGIPLCVILDGNLMTENLTTAGQDEVWLKSELQRRKLCLNDVFLGLCSSDGTLSLFPRCGAVKNQGVE